MEPQPTLTPCHPELVSGSYYRNITTTPENINNITSAFLTTQRHVRGGCATRKAAFTLAEVLITLGIIGVVAAMTLPVLINNYQAKETVTRLKKVYSILNQAYSMAQNDFGTIDNWGLSNSLDDFSPVLGLGHEVSKLFWSKFSPYMKTLKTCLDSTDINSDIKCSTYQYSALGPLAVRRAFYPRLILNDGAILTGGWINNPNCDEGLCGDFAVDINGANPPNVVGRDIFYFYIYKHKIFPMGLATDIYYSFENSCLRNASGTNNGYGCTAWVIFNENMDYLKCDGLSWSGKHKCK